MEINIDLTLHFDLFTQNPNLFMLLWDLQPIMRKLVLIMLSSTCNTWCHIMRFTPNWFLPRKASCFHRNSSNPLLKRTWSPELFSPLVKTFQYIQKFTSLWLSSLREPLKTLHSTSWVLTFTTFFFSVFDMSLCSSKPSEKELCPSFPKILFKSKWSSHIFLN